MNETVPKQDFLHLISFRKCYRKLGTFSRKKSQPGAKMTTIFRL